MTVIPALIVPLMSTQPVAAPGLILAWVMPVSATLSLVAFDLPPNRAAQRAPVPIDGMLDGKRLNRPLISTRLPLRSGGLRHVVVLRLPATGVARGQLLLSVAGRIAAHIDPRWLQSPIREPLDLVEGIKPEGAARLIRLLLWSIPSLFGRDLGAGFGQTARLLLELLRVPQGRLVSRCPVGSSGEVLSFRLPAPADTTARALVRLSANRPARLRDAPSLLEDGTLLHVFLAGCSQAGAELVMLGESPVLLRPSGAVEPQAFLPWLRRRPEAVRHWGEALLHGCAGGDKAVDALLHERRHDTKGRPGAQVHLLTTTRTGLLVWLDVADPNRLLTGLRVETPAGPIDVALPRSGQVRAFLRIGPMADGPQRIRLRHAFASGRISTFHEGPADRFSGSLPTGVVTDEPVQAGRALAEAWADRAIPVLPPQIDEFSTGAFRPRLSVIVPLAASADHHRARAALVACEPERDEIEVIYACAGTPTATAHRLMSETSGVYGVAHRLLHLGEMTSPSDLLIAAIAAARAPAALLLGAAVLPGSPGWAARWIARLEDPAGLGLIGGLLLAADGSVDHAGGQFVVETADGPVQAQPFASGLPADDLGDPGLRETRMLSAEATGLGRAAIAVVVAEGANCADPSAMLGLAALRLGARIDPSARLVRFAPAPQPDAVIEASGRWQVRDRLAAALPDGGR